MAKEQRLKNRGVGIPLTDKEWRDLRIDAAKAGSSLGQFVRALLVNRKHGNH